MKYVKCHQCCSLLLTAIDTLFTLEFWIKSNGVVISYNKICKNESCLFAITNVRHCHDLKHMVSPGKINGEKISSYKRITVFLALNFNGSNYIICLLLFLADLVGNTLATVINSVFSSRGTSV